MNHQRKFTFNLSQIFCGILLTLYINHISSVFASPVRPVLDLMNPESMESVVAECCKVHYTSKHHRVERLVPEGDSFPGTGRMTKLLHNDFYHQRINRKKCMKRHNESHLCASFSDSNICQSDYVKQKAIVENGWIREIWVENGCKFGRLWIQTGQLPLSSINSIKNLGSKIHSDSFVLPRFSWFLTLFFLYLDTYFVNSYSIQEKSN